MNQNTKNAVLYLRVSTDEQVENYSLGTQEEICQKEAERFGYTVIQIFKDEGKSAKNIIGRPALIQLLEYCRKNRKTVQAVIFYKTDRLSRQMADYLVIKEKLNSIGVKLISATEPIDDSPMGKFIGNFYAGIAQLDNETKSERVRTGMRARFRSGLPTCGTVPLGYIRHEGYVFKDQTTWDRVKKAWELMATGTKSLREMADIMNQWGLRTKHSSITYRLRPQTTSQIFRSKFYIGVLVSKRYVEEVRGQHEAMINNELFEKVQTILDGRLLANHAPTVKYYHANPDFPLRRFTKCGRCGLALTGAWSQGKKIKYPYYSCRFASKCKSSSIPVANMHDDLSRLLKQIKITQTGMAIFQILLADEFSKRHLELRMRTMKRDATLKKLLGMRETLIHKHLSGIYSDEVFTEQYKMITGSVENLKTANNTNLLKRYTLAIVNEYIHSQLNNLSETYKSFTLEQKKSLLSAVFPGGFTWNYPGLQYPKINPLFEA